MRVAALVPYHHGFCSGQRFRIELWAELLRERGIEIELFPFTSPALTDVLYRPGRPVQKAYRLLQCYADQLYRVLTAPRPDLVYIYREAALIGPPLIERLTRRWGVPIIYDLDEPLFVPYVSPSNPRFNFLRGTSKIDHFFRTSDHVLAVNEAIAGHAARYARRVSVVPMAVDTSRYHPADGQAAPLPPRIGWVGTRTTQPNLELIAGPLRRLTRSHGTVLRVIADEPMTIPGVDLDFISWNFEIEVPRLQECQIGVVPVKPSPWGDWKFFYKLVQMMGLGLPVVASSVGSNREIIRDGVNGFLASTDEEWYDKLSALIDNPNLRASVGKAARRTVEERFSLSGQIDFLEGLLKSGGPSAVHDQCRVGVGGVSSLG